jgi:hypothetical protein
MEQDAKNMMSMRTNLYGSILSTIILKVTLSVAVLMISTTVAINNHISAVIDVYKVENWDFNLS